MKGVKPLHCLDLNNTTELLELHNDDLDFDLNQFILSNKMNGLESV
jgi:hypothetical protein